ncbi:hypothetical protein ANCCAN_14189 [Ancylostoma caninum]|uniref:Uncharacterized protein n=1 Tax=Ancylostoma caninum TaxID=29170 RepID=A0A368G9A8_ANCCA|nr:hypothetical protein ANCCAN_14189 [Ancylostoma caninum]
MNDWEIGGTQNKWVCPSDRHLHLRAQLKSGWSVRTATARSPTNSKGNSGITEAEQEHIRQTCGFALDLHHCYFTCPSLVQHLTGPV